jgi:ribose/xylose/arabinose/galactoside ABC-type transport system permease subunit
MRRLLDRSRLHSAGSLIILTVLTGYFSIAQEGFLDAGNLLSLARQYAELGLVAVGMTLVIAAGGIDISVGGTVGLTGMLLGVLVLQHGWEMLPAAAVALAVAGSVGAVNGAAVAYLGMQPVLVTLATMSLTRGAAYVLTGGVSLSGFPQQFTDIATAGVAGTGIPVPVAITGLAFAGTAVLLRRTTFGRAVLASGASAEAAELSGIRVRRVRFATYLLLSLLAGVAGILLTARVSTSFADAGRNYEFEAITAVVLGGTSLTGGEASVLGTLAGVCTMAVLRNGLSLAGQSDLTRTQMLAVALLAAVLIDNLRRRLTS